MLDVLQAKRLPYFMSPRKPPEKCLQKTMSSKTVSSEKYKAKNHRVIFYIFDSINFFWNQTDTDRQLKFSKGTGEIGSENFIFHRNLCHNWQYFELRVIQRFDLNDICEWTYFFCFFLQTKIFWLPNASFCDEKICGRSWIHKSCSSTHWSGFKLKNSSKLFF